MGSFENDEKVAVGLSICCPKSAYAFKFSPPQATITAVFQVERPHVKKGLYFS